MENISNLRKVGIAVSALAVSAVLMFATMVPVNAGKPSKGNTIVNIVLADDGEFDVLQAAVIEAGLAGVLSGNRPYTVFAPTDQAFINLVAQLTNQSPSDVTEQDAIDAVTGLDDAFLTDVLLYHVTNGKRYSQSIVNANQVRMANGQFAKVGPGATIDGAGIIDTDIKASNGVIHVVNAVLLP